MVELLYAMCPVGVRAVAIQLQVGERRLVLEGVLAFVRVLVVA